MNTSIPEALSFRDASHREVGVPVLAFFVPDGRTRLGLEATDLEAKMISGEKEGGSSDGVGESAAGGGGVMVEVGEGVRLAGMGEALSVGKTGDG